jgi:16S rRNA (cytosine1402-N4)-methyltransferase
LRSRFDGQDVDIVHDEFLSALERLAGEGRQFDLVMADLGVSSPHLNRSDRGFSFSSPGPLDMRMDQRQPLTADHLVNRLTAADLAKILRDYGQEAKASAIARAVVAARPVNDTGQLAAIISDAAGFKARRGRIHPATKSFQAIRIAVNDELTQLRDGLPLMLEVLSPGGRMAVISFHSLEDRLVKNFLADNAGANYDAQLEILTKRPVTAGRDEIASNPRARSAKLRVARKK